MSALKTSNWLYDYYLDYSTKLSTILTWWKVLIITVGILPYERLKGMCRWMGSHFHDWIDHNRVAATVFHYIVFLIFRWPYKNYKIHNPKEHLKTLYPSAIYPVKINPSAKFSAYWSPPLSWVLAINTHKLRPCNLKMAAEKAWDRKSYFIVWHLPSAHSRYEKMCFGRICSFAQWIT